MRRLLLAGTVTVHVAAATCAGSHLAVKRGSTVHQVRGTAVGIEEVNRHVVF